MDFINQRTSICENTDEYGILFIQATGSGSMTTSSGV